MAIIKTDPKDYCEGDWAVWPYDLFPHYLCGPIGLPRGYAPSELVGERGLVLVKNYGKWFKPRLVVDAVTGQALYDLCESLRKDMDAGQCELNRLMMARRENALTALVGPMKEVLG
jgi:hypothetical protein